MRRPMRPRPQHGDARILAGSELEKITLALGQELAEARRSLDWTQRAVARKTGVSMQTIATYEAGTRHVSVSRFAELCRVLKQRPDELLCRAIDTARCLQHGGDLIVDMAALAGSVDPILLPLRRWASVRARQHPAERHAVEKLDRDAVTALAAATGTTADQLWLALARLAPTASVTNSATP